jgi:hypothetical protein
MPHEELAADHERLRAENERLRTENATLKQRLEAALRAGKRPRFRRAFPKPSPRNRAGRMDIRRRIAPDPSRWTGSKKRRCRRSVLTARGRCWKMRCRCNIKKTPRDLCRRLSRSSTCILGIVRSVGAACKGGIPTRRMLLFLLCAHFRNCQALFE